MPERKITTDHETIRGWAEARSGKPTTVRGTGGEAKVGVLRIDFPGHKGAGKLEDITWDEFFAKFEEKKLAFLYQEMTSEGKPSRFFKLIKREGATLERPKPARQGAGQSATQEVYAVQPGASSATREVQPRPQGAAASGGGRAGGFSGRRGGGGPRRGSGAPPPQAAPASSTAEETGAYNAPLERPDPPASEAFE